MFYSCFYVLMAVGPLVAGYLQDVWRSPAAGLVASAGALAAVVPLTLAFVSLLKPASVAGREGKTRLHASS